MFVPHKVLNVRNLGTYFFLQGEERMRQRLAEEEARAGAATVITAYRIPLAPVSSFKYLGRVQSESDEY